MIGLGSERSVDALQSFKDIDFAWCSYGNGGLEVVEKGTPLLRRWSYSAPSVMELRITAEVEYWLDGVLQHSSRLGDHRMLHAMASFASPGAEAVEIQWL